LTWAPFGNGHTVFEKIPFSCWVEFLICGWSSEMFFNMCRGSGFLEASPLEHLCVVVKHVLKSAFRVLFEVRLRNPGFAWGIARIGRWTSVRWSEGGRVQAFKSLYYEFFVVISKLFACACNIMVKQFNLNANVTLFNPSMFCRFECQIFVMRCRFHTEAKQGVKNVLLRGLAIINLR